MCVFIYMFVCIHTVYGMLLHLGMTEVSFYEILNRNSKNDTGNGKRYYVSFDQKIK